MIRSVPSHVVHPGDAPRDLKSGGRAVRDAALGESHRLPFPLPFPPPLTTGPAQIPAMRRKSARSAASRPASIQASSLPRSWVDRISASSSAGTAVPSRLVSNLQQCLDLGLGFAFASFLAFGCLPLPSSRAIRSMLLT